jgi:hypothetical protein
MWSEVRNRLEKQFFEFVEDDGEYLALFGPAPGQRHIMLHSVGESEQDARRVYNNMKANILDGIIRVIENKGICTKCGMNTVPEFYHGTQWLSSKCPSCIIDTFY